ncbi:MAG: hypothetical protein HY832_01575 [Candidatus Aenigmarchaeota archaeon]|nr:hypothetical protein [Candidatus Aenigmarchaeota archaeon]
MNDVLPSIIQLLTTAHVAFTESVHEPVTTSEHAARVRGTTIESGAKAIVVKTDTSFVMLVLSANKKLDSKKTKELLKSKTLRFATSQELMTITHCEPGAVPPFGMLFGLAVYADTSLLDQEVINFNAGRTDTSIAMKREDYVNLVHPVVGDFSKYS